MANPNFNVDIFEQARHDVDHKGMLSSMWHSSAMHSVRSATKSSGSGWSKGLGVAQQVGKAALNLIPVPVVGAVIGGMVDLGSAYARKRRHDGKVVKAQDLQELTKFQLKELSTGDLDRYRFKVADSVKELNDAVQKFKDGGGVLSSCDQCFVFALKLAQAERRVNKLMAAILSIEATLTITKQWMREVASGTAVKAAVDANDRKALDPDHFMADAKRTAGLDQVNSDIRTMITDFMTQEQARLSGMTQAQVDAEHLACQYWCVCKSTAHTKTFPGWRSRLNEAARLAALAGPIAYGTMLTLKDDDYQVGEAHKF